MEAYELLVINAFCGVAHDLIHCEELALIVVVLVYFVGITVI